MITKSEASVLVNALNAGVVPRIGLRHIMVGRQNEIGAFLQDLNVIAEGGAAFRFVTGKYGSGKTFLLQAIRNNATGRDFVVMDADLSPERRLTGSGQKGLQTYRELIQNTSTRLRPEGAALESILQRWIAGLQKETAKQGGYGVNDPELVEKVSGRIEELLNEMTEMAYGFAYAKVVNAYWVGMKTGNTALRQSAIRWMRAEYGTKTEARRDLGVDRIIDDDSWYEFLKLFAVFVAKIGYNGLLIFIDEGVNLYKISYQTQRMSNYEKILTIFNDTMQGKAHHIGFFMSGTREFIYDERRGLFSYEALRSRLSENRFGSEKYVDLTSPIISLKQLSEEEIFVLLERLNNIHGVCYGYDERLSEEDLTVFMNAILSRLGADSLLTPREITRDFLGMLNILHQNPEATVQNLVLEQHFEVRSAEKDPEQLEHDRDDAAIDALFAEFDL